MIKLDIKVGDTILVGRFKNKRIEVKEIGVDEHGGPTVNGRGILKIRIEKLMKTKKNLKESIDKKRILQWLKLNDLDKETLKLSKTDGDRFDEIAGDVAIELGIKPREENQLDQFLHSYYGVDEFDVDFDKPLTWTGPKPDGHYKKLSKESKQFKFADIAKKILKENSNDSRTFEDNCEILQKFESQDKSYSKEARELLQDADELSDEELNDTVNDFMETWKLTDPRITDKKTASSKPNPWDKDYRDGDFR